MRPWTRAHQKFALAWGELGHALAKAGSAPLDICGWLEFRWGVRLVRDLTVAQARCASRQVNAWRAGLEGRVTEFQPRPRQWRRNYRRKLLRTISPPNLDYPAYLANIDRRVAEAFAVPAHVATAGTRRRPCTAHSTASSPGADYENLIRGTVLEGLGRIVPTDSPIRRRRA